jgi:heme/copper-type cytochrome/quinol oxidase subunit 1
MTAVLYLIQVRLTLFVAGHFHGVVANSVRLLIFPGSIVYVFIATEFLLGVRSAMVGIGTIHPEDYAAIQYLWK